jgi:hypothetical protein
MSIDLYPALDAGEMDVAVALERRAAAGGVAPLERHRHVHIPRVQRRVEVDRHRVA